MLPGLLSLFFAPCAEHATAQQASGELVAGAAAVNCQRCRCRQALNADVTGRLNMVNGKVGPPARLVAPGVYCLLLPVGGAP